MKYRQFGKTGEKVSALGFGAMRLPVIDDKMDNIDEMEAIRMIRHAIDNGVNYVDTAYVYHGGKGEEVVGKALKEGYREKVFIATKLPVWNAKVPEDLERLLDQQLKNLQTDLIDFYLVHSLNKAYWRKLINLGLLEFLERVQKKGKIKHVGFSFHDEYELFKEIVDSFPWSFCLIQYNYLDINYQAGKKGLQYAASKGIGIAVMEPLRGGMLANKLIPEAQEVLDKSKIKVEPAQLGLQWVWSHPEVSIVLSGMSNFEQVEKNLAYAENSEEGLTLEETELIDKIRSIYESKSAINCTDCKYCLPCPAGVNIPLCFTHFNRAHMYNDVKGAYFGMSEYLMKMQR
jgi:predicted aldo/keto reductase-like oxidoreductase